MATTTTNYGFDVPTSSDLVKNGATQIALLGQDIDTFMFGSPARAGGKNFVINGNQEISQRGTSFAAVVTDYTTDRWQARNGGVGVFTVSQESDAPTGFGKSAKWLCTTADASLAAGDFAIYRTKFEGQALQTLQKGSASALTTTLSFWVKSNLTGTYVVRLYDTDNTRSISASYTISASATWEKKTVTFAGDTTGAFTDDNGQSMDLEFWLGAGSTYNSGTLQTSWASVTNANSAVGQTNLAATLNNYWQVTGIQWEIGSTATPFSLAGGTIQGELAACQRYYYRTTVQAGQHFANGLAQDTITAIYVMPYPVTMRTAPTALEQSGTATDYSVRTGVTNTTCSGVPLFGNASTQNAIFSFTVASGLVASNALFARPNVNGAYLGWSAEL
jgi:hypothetical protein